MEQEFILDRLSSVNSQLFAPSVWMGTQILRPDAWIFTGNHAWIIESQRYTFLSFQILQNTTEIVLYSNVFFLRLIFLFFMTGCTKGLRGIHCTLH